MKKVLNKANNSVTYIVGDGYYSSLVDALKEKSKHKNPKWANFLRMTKHYPYKYRVSVEYTGELLGTRFAFEEVQNNSKVLNFLGIPKWYKQIDYFYSGGKYD